MISGMQTGLLALRSFSRAMGATAHNVANTNTEGFKRQTAVMRETPAGPVTDIGTDPTPGPLVAGQKAGQPLTEQSNTNLVKEMTDAMIREKGYAANARQIQEADEMTGTLLDIKR